LGQDRHVTRVPDILGGGANFSKEQIWSRWLRVSEGIGGPKIYILIARHRA